MSRMALSPSTSVPTVNFTPPFWNQVTERTTGGTGACSSSSAFPLDAASPPASLLVAEAAVAPSPCDVAAAPSTVPGTPLDVAAPASFDVLDDGVLPC